MSHPNYRPSVWLAGIGPVRPTIDNKTRIVVEIVDNSTFYDGINIDSTSESIPELLLPMPYEAKLSPQLDSCPPRTARKLLRQNAQFDPKEYGMLKIRGKRK